MECMSTDALEAIVRSMNDDYANVKDALKKKIETIKCGYSIKKAMNYKMHQPERGVESTRIKGCLR